MLQVAALAMMDKVIHDSKTEKKTKEDKNLKKSIKEIKSDVKGLKTEMTELKDIVLQLLQQSDDPE